jgi:hypothetical protein
LHSPDCKFTLHQLGLLSPAAELPSSLQEQLRTKDEALSATQRVASEAASERDSLAQQLKEAKEGLTKQAAVTPSQVEVTLFRAT